MQTIRIQLLGDFSITVDGRPIPTLTGGKVLSLLAFLLLHRPRQSRKHISYLFWPDSDEQQAMTNLRKLLLLLRRSLPDSEHYLKADSLSLQWNDQSSFILDVAQFEQFSQSASTDQLKEAVTLYKGPLMPGFYEEWIVSERDRLAQLHQHAVETLIHKLEFGRNYNEALYYAKILLRLDPLREESYQTSMRLHALCGDWSGAAKVYQDCEAVLQDELGIRPSTATKQIYDSIQKAAEGSNSSEQNHETPSFVGRDAEWRTIVSFWKRARIGKPQIVLISGEPGIGKTRLAEEFRDWLDRQGIQTAMAKCYASEGALTYAPIVNWLKSIELPRLEPVWLSELSRFIPELSVKHSNVPTPLPLRENWQRIRLFEALRKALAGHRPSVYILDDIQWCDEASIHWLHDLYHHEAASPTMIVATVRSGDESDALQSFLSNVRANNQLTDIVMSPLSLKDTRTLAEDVLREAFPEQSSDRLYDQTGGNPLFIIETLRTDHANRGERNLTDDRSSSIQHVILDRFSKLPDSLNRLIYIASAIGFSFPFKLMEKLAEMERDNLLDHFELLCNKSILKPTESYHYMFTHDRLRETAYQSLSIVRRRQYHGQIAVAMEAVYADELDAYAGQIAYHYEQAGMPKQAVQYFRKAAQAAASLYANEAAILNYRRILELAADNEKPDLLFQIAKIYEVVGKREEAQRLYRQVLDDQSSMMSLKEKARFKAALGNCLSLMSRLQDALHILKQAYTDFEILNDQAGISYTLTVMGIVYYYLGQSSDALAAFNKREEIAAEFREEREDCRIAGIKSVIYMERNEEALSVYWGKRKIQIAEKLHDLILLSQSIGSLGIIYNELGRHDQALACVHEKLRLSRQTGEHSALTVGINILANVYEAYGEYGNATASYLFCINHAHQEGDTRHAAALTGYLGRSLTQQGDYQSALPILQRCIADLRELNIRGYFLINSLFYLAELYEKQARYAEALETADEALHLARQLECRLPEFKISLLKLTLEVRRLNWEPDEIKDNIDLLRPLAVKQEQQNEICYIMWKLGIAPPQMVKETADAYNVLYTNCPIEAFRSKYCELSGLYLPKKTVPIELPNEVKVTPTDLQAFIRTL